LTQETCINIKVESCTFADLIGLNGGTNKYTKLAIPEYQRPYMWGDKQINKLIEDIIEHNNNFQEGANDYPLYYLGSIILHYDCKENKFFIIDGQQRITTMLIITSLCEDKNKLPEISYSSPKSIRNIKKNYKILNDKLMDECKDFFKPEKFNFTLVITQREDDAYTFFETHNTAGVRLTAAQIIKPYHLRNLSEKMMRYNALEWEERDDYIKDVIKRLTKARYWNSLYFKEFPFYKNKSSVKNALVEEFTDNTQKGQPISYIHTEVLHNNFEETVRQPGGYKEIRQPLYEGLHTIKFLTEYADLYRLLFKIKKTSNEPRIDARFFNFRDHLITGANGTIFLKELFEIACLCYVSRLGLSRLFEFSLWAFRYIYSPRISNQRTVKESTVVNFVKDNKILDKILYSFSHEEILYTLSTFTYDVSPENIVDSKNTVKSRYVEMLANYFGLELDGELYSYEKFKENFDNKLITAITKSLEE